MKASGVICPQSGVESAAFKLQEPTLFKPCSPISPKTVQHLEFRVALNSETLKEV